MSRAMAEGRGCTQSPLLRANETKNTSARSAQARSAAKTHALVHICLSSCRHYHIFGGSGWMIKVRVSCFMPGSPTIAGAFTVTLVLRVLGPT